MTPAPLTPDPMTIMTRCDQAEEDLEAYLADSTTSRAERGAALACQVIVDGLRTVTLVADVVPRWDGVLFTLEAISRADTVGRPASHVYRTTYRILAGTSPAHTRKA